MNLKVIITGASGMVGEGVLLECMDNPLISEILILTRKSCKISHSKICEIIVEDFMDLSELDKKLIGYDACYFCLGVSSVGMDEIKYSKLTYDLTLHFANVLRIQSPNLTFCYVSGSGTDSSEKGKTMWARVKGKTENQLLHLGFKDAYMFRPGLMKARKDQKNIPSFYKYIIWIYPILRKITPSFVSTLEELAKSMIYVSINSNKKKILEVKDFVRLAHK